MRRIHIFILAGFFVLTLIIGSVLFVRDRRPSIVNQDQIWISEKQSGGTRLVSAPTQIPSIGYDAWKESHAERVQLAGYYSKDGAGAYWYHQKIVGANPVTFDTYSDQYAHDEKTVYYNSNYDVFTIRGADPASFQALGDGYAKDANHAYFRGEEVIDADPGTFESLWPIDVLYAKDKNFVYRENKKFLGFDAPSFRIAEKLDRSPVYLIDKSRVVIGKAEAPRESNIELEDEEVIGADPITFVALGGMWGKDKERAYYGVEAIEDSDPKTFQVLGTNNHDFGQMAYAKDRNNVYYTSKRIFDADPLSFEIVENVWMLSGSFGKDKNSAYRDGEIFSKQDLISLQKSRVPLSAKHLGGNYYLYLGVVSYYLPPVQSAPCLCPVYAKASSSDFVHADPTTFKFLKGKYARDEKNIYYDGSFLTHDPTQSFTLLTEPYAKDSQKVFFGNDVIEGAIPQTFQILSAGYSKDESSVFYNTKKVPGVVDIDTFSVLGKGLSSDVGYHGSAVYYSYAKDSSQVFCLGEILTGADVRTFVLKGKNGMPQDKFRYYDGCERKK